LVRAPNRVCEPSNPTLQPLFSGGRTRERSDRGVRPKVSLGALAKTMAHRKLMYGYHDAQLEGCQVGPQREVILDIRLDPVWNRHAPRHVRLRFGAIQNFDDVQSFFDRVLARPDRAPEGFIDEIAGIVCTAKGAWVVDLDRGGSVTIGTPKMPNEQSRADPAGRRRPARGSRRCAEGRGHGGAQLQDLSIRFAVSASRR